VRLDEFLLVVAVALFIIIVVVLARKFKANPHTSLTRLIEANIVLDLIAIAIWMIPAAQWSVYRLGFVAASVEAGVAAAVFALTLFGLIRRKKWAPYLIIAATVAQRVFATYIFFPSIALSITLIWSLMIVCFAYMDIKSSKPAENQGKLLH
jgi:hypothetical protein